MANQALLKRLSALEAKAAVKRAAAAESRRTHNIP
jgi:hypothetical protein